MGIHESCPTTRGQPSIETGEYSQLTAEGALRVLKDLVTIGSVSQYLTEGKLADVDSQRARINGLLEDPEFVRSFGNFWKVAIETSKRKTTYWQSDLAKYAKNEEQNAAIIHVATVHALSVTYCGAGVLLNRETVPLGRRSKYTRRFMRMDGNQIREIYENYLFTKGFFDYAFLQASNSQTPLTERTQTSI